MPDPDRRVGRLCAPASRPERPAGGQLRDAVHLCTDVDRIGEGGRQLPCSWSACPRPTPAASPHASGRRRRGGRAARARGARPAAQRDRARRVVVAARERRRRASRSCGGACSSRSPTPRSSGTATSSRARSPTTTAASTRSSRPSAVTPTTRSGLAAAYPIHPEIFDRLYTDWSTLVTFQRTRGVLRLMAAVIHSLWEKGDRNPLILPAHLADRRPPGAVRADALPARPLGARDREGRRRPERPAPAHRRRGRQPRQVLGMPARRAHRVPRVGPTTRRARRSAGSRTGASSSAASCPASRRTSSATRCGAWPPRPPTSTGWSALLVRHAADGDEASGGPRRAVAP